MAITIKQVSSKKELKEFILFNYSLYKDNKYAVPDLYDDLLFTLSKDKNAAFEFCEAEYFLAYKKGKLVGRIAGLINHKANKDWEKNEVRFGWVDFIDDQEVSQALFDCVSKWGKSKGMEYIQGPLGFTDLDPEGMLIEGFEQLGTMASIYNYPYYPKHMAQMGFEKDADWIEFQVYIPDAIPEKHQRISNLIQRKYNLTIKKFKSNKQLVKQYGHAIFNLINEAYAKLYGFTALSDKQIEQVIKSYLPLLNLKMVTLITDPNDVLVGFGVAIPSLSKALQKAKGSMLPLGWFHLLKALYWDKPQVIDLMLVAIKPEYQNKGVNALLFSDLIPIFQKEGCIFAESNPELEENEKVQAQWEYFKTVQHKRRRAFVKRI